MGQRLDLQDLLVEILGTDNVYFQPPPSFKMNYPCIVYRRDSAITRFANDKPYNFRHRYQVTFISRDPDDATKEKIAALPMCIFDRFHTVDNLNHDVFKLYF